MSHLPHLLLAAATALLRRGPRPPLPYAPTGPLAAPELEPQRRLTHQWHVRPADPKGSVR